MEFESALLEAAKDSHSRITWEEIQLRHSLSPSAVAPLRRIGVLQLKRVQRRRLSPEGSTHAFVDVVLQHIEVEVHQRRVLVRLLKAAGVVRNGESVSRIGK